MKKFSICLLVIAVCGASNSFALTKCFTSKGDVYITSLEECPQEYFMNDPTVPVPEAKSDPPVPVPEDLLIAHDYFAKAEEPAKKKIELQGF